MNDGKTALITGASGGIGYELAKLFAKDHYNLVLVARGAPKLTQVADELQRQFGISAKSRAARPHRCGSSAISVRPTAARGHRGRYSGEQRRLRRARRVFEGFAGRKSRTDSAEHHRAHSPHQALSRPDDRTAFRQDPERGFDGRISTRPSHGRLLRNQSVRHLVFRRRWPTS